MAVLFDDGGLVLTLMKAGQAAEVKYPASFPPHLFPLPPGERGKVRGASCRRARSG